ncbi:MAG: MATE family efflux transporter [Provencibacterium sp.]|jgi:putative MATE family efflux protein|nr:MATE family efflux transporter [Provencibacterium sp.]
MSKIIQLSDHFDIRRLLRYTFPSIIMLVFTSIYGVVDGFFVSNFVGKTPFAAVNFIMPFLMILGGAGFMFGTGGSALIAKTLGEGKLQQANRLFSLIVYISAACALLLTALGLLVLRPVASLLGARGQMLEGCVLYGQIILAALPFFILQNEFQCFFATAGKPKLGLAITMAAGIINMVLDALFIAFFRWGIAGAAAATALSQLVGGIIPLFYFFRDNPSSLRLTRCTFNGRALLKTCTNGSSELMSNLSMSLISMLYNAQLMRYAGEDGIAAYGVLMYVSFIFQAIFIGYSVGSSPVIGYHYGADNRGELKNLLQKSLLLIGIFSGLMFLSGQTLARPLSLLFTGYDQALLAMTHRAFRLYSISFLFSGFAIFGSAFFTALGDGLTSAFLSFMRTLFFQCLAVLLFPLIWGLDGIWFATAAADGLSVLIVALLLFVLRKKYHYAEA